MPDSSEVIKNILHYQKSLDRYSQRQDATKILHCIFKLFSMPVTVGHLQETGIGRTVNSLRKIGGEVEDAAKTLIKKWKQMVAEGVESEETENSKPVENKSSHKHSGDRHRNGDSANDKPNKEDRKYKGRNTAETKASKSPSDKSSSSSDDSSSSYNSTEDDDRESGVATESDRCSSVDEPMEVVPKSYEPSKELQIEKRNVEHRRESDKNDQRREKSTSSDDRLKREHSESEQKKQKRHSSSSESSGEPSKKRRRDSTSSEEENRKKPVKKSEDSHKSSSSHRHSHSEVHKSSTHRTSGSSSRSTDGKKDSHREKDAKSHSHSSSRSDKHHKSSESSRSKDKSAKSDDRSKKESGSSKRVEEKDGAKSKSSSSKSSSSKKKSVDICSQSGTSFAEALGMLEPSTSKVSSAKKSRSSEVNTSHKPEKTEKQREKSAVPKPQKCDNIDLVIPPPPPKTDIDVDVFSLLPSITPNYRPVANPFVDSNLHRSKVLNDDEALSMVMSQKNLRTKVYSGNKCLFGTVPSLFELCIRVLQDNIDALEYTGGVPYAILKPILDKATAEQLFTLEHHNPYLIEDTDDMWMYHCQKEFRNKKREEMESWREMYMRCLDEREAKLKALTENIKLAQDKSTPLRQTKLAYVDSVVKPPRDVIRKQAKNGIIDSKKPNVTPSSRLAAIATAGASSQAVVPNPVRSSGGGSSAKPKKAPLMQKTLQFMKGNRFRR